MFVQSVDGSYLHFSTVKMTILWNNIQFAVFVRFQSIYWIRIELITVIIRSLNKQCMERSNDCKAKQLSDITAKTAVNAGRSVRRFFHVQCASHISKRYCNKNTQPQFNSTHIHRKQHTRRTFFLSERKLNNWLKKVRFFFQIINVIFCDFILQWKRVKKREIKTGSRYRT